MSLTTKIRDLLNDAGCESLLLETVYNDTTVDDIDEYINNFMPFDHLTLKEFYNILKGCTYIEDHELFQRTIDYFNIDNIKDLFILHASTIEQIDELGYTHEYMFEFFAKKNIYNHKLINNYISHYGLYQTFIMAIIYNNELIQTNCLNHLPIKEEYMVYAAKYNRYRLMMYLTTECDCKMPDDAAYVAAAEGHYEAMVYSYNNNIHRNDILDYVKVDLSCVEYLFFMGAWGPKILFRKVIDEDNVNVYRYLCKFGYDNEVIYISAKNAINCLKYLVEEDKVMFYNDIMYIATTCCSIDCVKYLHSLGIQLYWKLSYYASEKGNIEAYMYAYNNNLPMFTPSLSILLHLFSNGITNIQYVDENIDF